jgi:hypothetical protein
MSDRQTDRHEQRGVSGEGFMTARSSICSLSKPPLLFVRLLSFGFSPFFPFYTHFVRQLTFGYNRPSLGASFPPFSSPSSSYLSKV